MHCILPKYVYVDWVKLVPSYIVNMKLLKLACPTNHFLLVETID